MALSKEGKVAYKNTWRKCHFKLQVTENVEMSLQKVFEPIVTWIPSGRYLNIAKSALA